MDPQRRSFADPIDRSGTRWGCSSVGRASDRHTADQVPLPGAAREFSTGANFQCRLSCGVRTPPCACINICVHVKDPVVHGEVCWIMETLNHPACTVGRVARPCHNWLSLGKATRISHGKNFIGTMQLQKAKKSKVKKYKYTNVVVADSTELKKYFTGHC